MVNKIGKMGRKMDQIAAEIIYKTNLHKTSTQFENV